MITKFETTGNVADKARSGRPSIQTVATQEAIRERVELSQTLLETVSCRQLSVETELSPMTIQRILRKKLKFFPYKMKILQCLNENDKRRRLLFCNELLLKITEGNQSS